MWSQYSKLFFFATLITLTVPAFAQQQRAAPKPQDTEVWEPVPKIVTTGVSNAADDASALRLIGRLQEDRPISKGGCYPHIFPHK